MKRSFWFVLFIFCVSVFMAGCSCLPWFQCGQVAQETPPPQAVVTPAPPPPPAVVQPAPPLKQDRN